MRDISRKWHHKTTAQITWKSQGHWVIRIKYSFIDWLISRNINRWAVHTRRIPKKCHNPGLEVVCLNPITTISDLLYFTWPSPYLWWCVIQDMINNPEEYLILRVIISLLQDEDSRIAKLYVYLSTSSILYSGNLGYGLATTRTLGHGYILLLFIYPLEYTTLAEVMTTWNLVSDRIVCYTYRTNPV